MLPFSLSLKRIAVAVAVTLLPFAVLSWALIEQLQRRSRYPTLEFPLFVEPWFLGACLLACALFWLWSSWRVLGTTLTDDFIRQPTIFGVSEVCWSEATTVRLSSGQVLKLSGPNGTVWLRCYLYSDPLAVLTFVLNKVALNGRAAVA